MAQKQAPKIMDIAFVIIGIAAMAFYASAFFPGYLTSDSIYMLSQGIGQTPLSNWHPPFITVAWGALHKTLKSEIGRAHV